MKKCIPLLLALLCLLSGCTGAPAETAAPAAEPATAPSTELSTEQPAPQPVGTLYVTCGAVLEIDYDENGNALTLTGINETGKILAEAKQDQLGKGCVYTLRAILRYAINNGLMNDVKAVTVRVGADDPLPSEDFLITIGQDCQYLIDEELSGVDMYCITGDLLDEQGKLTFEAAQTLASKYLESEATPAETTEVDVFTFTAGDRTCTVDAFTGLVTGQ